MDLPSTPKARSKRKRTWGLITLALERRKRLSKRLNMNIIEEETEDETTSSQSVPRGESSILSSVINSGVQSQNPIKKERGSQKRRRRPKKPSLSLFSSTPTVKVRPRAFLNAQEIYATEILPSKIRALNNDKNLCFAMHNYQLEMLEANLFKRLEMVSNLKLYAEDNNNVLINKKYSLITKIEDEVLKLQQLSYTKQMKLDEERASLRIENQGAFACCTVCHNKSNY